MLQLRRYKKLRALLTKWTQYEILARLAPLGFPDYADYHMRMLDVRDDIRKLMFKSSDLVYLGTAWGILADEPTKKQKKKKRPTSSPKRKTCSKKREKLW
jgi:hypothetical protein